VIRLPLLNLTEKLSKTIKEERLKKDIKGSQLAEMIGKTAAYISQVENNKLKQIDYNVLHDIFRNLIEEDVINEYMDKLVSENYNGLTIEQIKKQEWAIALDYQYRNIPIPESLIDFINSKMKELNATVEELTNQINKNEDLIELDRDNLAEDRLYLFIDDKEQTEDEKGMVSTTIRLNIKEESIENVLSRKTTSIGHIYMLSIVYNLLKLEGLDRDEASDKASDILKEHKFYTEFERYLIKKENKDNDCPALVGNLTELYQAEYTDLMNRLSNHILKIKVLDIDRAVKKLKILDDNFKFDYGLMFAIIGMPIKNLKEDQKQAFFKEYKELIKKFSEEEKEDNLLSLYE